MKFKLWMAKRVARRLSNRTRQERRALRDYQRQESKRIRAAEARARGLRLFIAWSVRGKSERSFAAAPVWSAQVPATA